MILACETSDGYETGTLFIGDVEPILAALSQKGITEKQVWECQLSLKRAGYIRLHANYNTEDIDPTWSHAAPHFTITPFGLRWWFIRKYGQVHYSQMVRTVKDTRNECLKAGVLTIAAWAERLNMPLLVVQKIMYAEGL
jgi:hypothetical protein